MLCFYDLISVRAASSLNGGFHCNVELGVTFIGR
jgi:hypothetical protein